MASRLREHFSTAGKDYYLSAAPQCVIPDANVGELIKNVPMDMIFIQFYNTPYCSARAFFDGGAFSYNDWAAAISGSPSRDAKLYVGLPSDVSGSGTPSHYLHGNEVEQITAAHANDAHFGGIMILEAGRSQKNSEHGKPYHQIAKDVLNRLPDRSASLLEAVKAAPSKENIIAALFKGAMTVASPKDATTVTTTKVRTSLFPLPSSQPQVHRFTRPHSTTRHGTHTLPPLAVQPGVLCLHLVTPR